MGSAEVLEVKTPEQLELKEVKEYEEAWEKEELLKKEAEQPKSTSVTETSENKIEEKVVDAELPEKTSDEITTFLKEKGVATEALKALEVHGGLDSFVKAFDDTKQSHDRLMQQVKEAEKNESDVKKRFEVSELTSKLSSSMEEYDPALQEAIQPLLDEVALLKSSASAQSAALEQKTFLEAEKSTFISTIVPQLDVANQVDCLEIFGSKAYLDWAGSQTPMLKYAALNSDNPSDIDVALNSFKTFRATPQANELLHRQTEQKNTKLMNNISLQENTGVPAPNMAADDGKSYNEIWNELEKQGL